MGNCIIDGLKSRLMQYLKHVVEDDVLFTKSNLEIQTRYKKDLCPPKSAGKKNNNLNFIYIPCYWKPCLRRKVDQYMWYIS